MSGLRSDKVRAFFFCHHLAATDKNKSIALLFEKLRAGLNNSFRQLDSSEPVNVCPCCEDEYQSYDKLEVAGEVSLHLVKLMFDQFKPSEYTTHSACY
jgi:hypothetical protein